MCCFWQSQVVFAVNSVGYVNSTEQSEGDSLWRSALLTSVCPVLDCLPGSGPEPYITPSHLPVFPGGIKQKYGKVSLRNTQGNLKTLLNCRILQSLQFLMKTTNQERDWCIAFLKWNTFFIRHPKESVWSRTCMESVVLWDLGVPWPRRHPFCLESASCQYRPSLA